jgi:hypothetical protein
MPKSIKNFHDKEKARIYRNNQRKENYHRGGFIFQGKRRWDNEEKKLLMGWDKNTRLLAKILKRSVQSIQSKRYRLKHEEI